MHKILLTVAVVSGFIRLPAQALDQQHFLNQYAGTWLSTSANQPVSEARIKVVVVPKLNGSSLQVDVFEKTGGTWKPILTELIGYDSTTGQIVAAGQDSLKRCFIGQGSFSDPNHWVMQDRTFSGDPTRKVSFDFVNRTEVHLESAGPSAADCWKIEYIKANPQDKNIGIQLVSVKDAMEADPVGTLTQLRRMGYSYVETFVYKEGKFYGMTPLDFKNLLVANGLRFEGSMTFKNLPKDSDWAEAMQWWETCIDDHDAAGVKYLTTSNNEIRGIKSLAELQRYCDYYNAVGRLCQKKGIQFGFHNHADEFLQIEGVTVYDYLLQHTDPALVSFQVDLQWMNVGGGDPVRFFQKYPGRFFSWHVKDDGELGLSGKVDFGNLYSHAREAGLKYNVVEVEKHRFPPLDGAEMAYRFLYDADFVKPFGN